MSSDGFEPTQESLDKARVSAAESGLAVIEPQPDVLLLDCDSWQDKLRASAMLDALGRLFGGFEVIDRYKSKSGKGWHLVVKIGVQLTPIERVALQASLGSDGFREMLAVACIRNGVCEPSSAFQTAGGQVEYHQEKRDEYPSDL